MIRKQRTRWFILVLGLILTLTGWWFLNGQNGDGAPISPVATMGLDSADVGVRETIPKAEAESPDEVSEVAKDLTSPPGDKKRRKPQVDRDSRKALELEPWLKERKRFEGLERKWIAVDEFGLPVVESAWILIIEEEGVVRPVEVSTDKQGRFGLHPSKIPADATFRALLSRDGNYVVEWLGQEVHKPLQSELVVRATGTGHLHIRWVPADGAPSKLRYSALLFAPGESWRGYLPEQASDRSLGMDVDMDVAPGLYELVLAPEGGILHGVLEQDYSPIRIHIQPGGFTNIQLQEPEWNEAEWNVQSSGYPEPMTMSIVGSPRNLPLMFQPDMSPLWRRAVRPKTHTPYLIRPKPTLARLSGTAGDHRFALLRDGFVGLIQGRRSERDVQLDFLAGTQVQTTIHSLTQVPTPLEFLQAQPQDVDGRVSMRTPNWIKVEAEYANDTAWSKVVATVVVNTGKKKLKLASSIKPRILDLDKPEVGRATPPASPGLRWSYEGENSAISHLAVDYLPSRSLHIEVPIPKESGSDFLGTLSWTPDSTPGTMAIGAWQVDPKRRKKNKTPGFRTFQLQCVQSSGEPAPFAMVQAQGISDKLRWSGTADSKGLLRLEVLGSGPFWIDSGLVQNPVQIQLHAKSEPSKDLKLMVPMRHNRIDMFVSGEEDFDLSQLTVRLNLWKQPKEFPGRIYPDIAQGNLNADGQISFQSLVPALYRLEVFDPRFPKNVRSRKVRLSDRDSNPHIMIHWRP